MTVIFPSSSSPDDLKLVHYIENEDIKARDQRNKTKTITSKKALGVVPGTFIAID